MATEYFLAFDGPKIEGESKKKGHEKEIAVLGWEIGGKNDGSLKSRGGTFYPNDITVYLVPDKASVRVFENCAKGTHIAKAILSGRVSGGGSIPYDFLKITLAPCLIRNFNTNGSQVVEELSGSMLSGSILINFIKITYEYFVQDSASGTVSPTGSVTYDSETGEVK